MAQFLCPPLSESWILSASWGPARPPPTSDRDFGCSPASSPDSWDSAPAGSPVPSPGRPVARAALRAATAGRRGARSSRLGSGQRQSASEREKLRMRTLARALHELRRFLPPSVAPAGQSLTKIETLRLAIRYIGHLSAVLGLSEESLQRRRRNDSALPRGCALCPDGGPKQTQTCGPGLGSAASAAACWGSPPACPAPLEAPEPRDLPVLYHEAACPEGQAMEPDHASPVSTSFLARNSLPCTVVGGATYCLVPPARTAETCPATGGQASLGNIVGVPGTLKRQALSRRRGRAGTTGDLDAPGVATGLNSCSDDGQLAPCSVSTDAFLAAAPSKRSLSRLPFLEEGAGDTGMGIVERESLSPSRMALSNPSRDGETLRVDTLRQAGGSA